MRLHHLGLAVAVSIPVTNLTHHAGDSLSLPPLAG